MESTFALNALQKLDHCFTITVFFFYSITRCRIFWKQNHFIDIVAYGKQRDRGTFYASTLYNFL